MRNSELKNTPQSEFRNPHSNMFDLEKALAAWRHPYTYSHKVSKQDLDEVERHLRDQIADLVAVGETPEEAFRQAMAEMGSMLDAEGEYGKVYWQKVQREGALLREVGVRWALLMNYVKLAYRNMLRNKAASVINVTGLAIAVGCTLVVYTFLDRALTMDRFHPDGERIFLVENVIERNGNRQAWGEAPHPLGPAMAADFPQIEQFARVEQSRATMQANDKVFIESAQFADPAFLEMFNFPLRYGDAAALHEENSVILSHKLALKYFGEGNPVGETVVLTFGDHREAFTVRGVAAPFSDRASFDFNMLLSYEKLYDVVGESPDDWSAFTKATFIKLHSADDLPHIAGSMDRYLELNHAASEDWPIAAFVFDDLYSLAINSHKVRSDISGGPAPMGFILLSLIAVFLLSLACFNYMNIAIATAQRRLKEVGVRKVMGSNRTQLAFQFLCENVLLCLLALVLGVILAATLFLPGFNALFAEGDTMLVFDIGSTGRSWVFLIGLLMLIGVASGAYPAFYISRFQPMAIFRHVPTRGSKRWFTRTFLTFQFVLTFITMIAGVLFYQNATYQEQQAWGYDQEHLVVMRMSEPGQYRILEQKVQQMPNVRSVAGSAHQPGRGEGYAVIDIQGEKKEARRFDVGHGFFETLGIRLRAGRFFDPQRNADAVTMAIINETFAQSQGWDAERALGQSFRYDSTSYTIIGVLADFHYEDFTDAIEPALFLLADDADLRYLSARVQPGTEAETIDAFGSLWKQTFPNLPGDVSVQSDVFAYFYRDNNNVARLFGCIALMALLISCMGLFGLASQNVARRMKEISIRKVLGASVLQVSVLVNRGFFIMLTLAACIALPLAYVALNALLADVYVDHAPFGLAPFGIAYILIFATALLTVTTQIRRVVRTNPAEVLRNE